MMKAGLTGAGSGPDRLTPMLFPALRYELRDASATGEARRGAAELARSLELSEVRQGELAIIVTELASNVIKHAGEGEILLQARTVGGQVAIEVLALDRGPGIARPAEVFRDGYSTAGTPGTGLGATQRLAGSFDLSSVPEVGTAVLARVFRGTLPPEPVASTGLDVGAVALPYPGETVCGDAAAVLTGPDGGLGLLLVDGLGHGLGAHDAAQAAVRAFQAAGRTGGIPQAPDAWLTAVHGAMRGTRGGVGAVATLEPGAVDSGTGTVSFAGVGNISAVVVGSAGRRGLMSHNGTLGQSSVRPQVQTAPWDDSSLLVMHSDGLQSGWNLERYPGLLHKPASLIAGVLYRDHVRGRDDVTVLVVRGAGSRF